jgi:tRNA(Ile)-lysidine synthase
MLKQFAKKIEDIMRLIEETQSASFCHAEHSERSSARFLLAVSGGMDSMCLLDLFSQVVPSSNFAVAHCNFSLRGQESDEDQTLVEERAQELGVKIFVKRFDTEVYAREMGISIEMAARDLRYEWFGQLCKEHGFDAVAVAHNANDNAETLVLNLLRGTGLNGLHGILAVQERTGCVVVRPMLEMTRKQIEGYVMAHRVPYRNDSSNFESDYKRNRIRNEVFPIFEKINPSFVKTLNREIGYFAEAGSIVEDWCRAQMPNVVSYPESSPCHPERSEGSVSISIPSLLSTKNWRYLLYYILEPYGFNSATLESLEDLLESDRTVSGKRFESATHLLYTERDSLVVKPVLNEEISDRYIMVPEEGIYELNGVRWQVEVLERTPDFNLKQPVGTLVMDADKMAFPFVCRAWKQGDWLVPFGLKGRKKVSDLFADLKFTQIEKARAIMMVDCDGELAENQRIAGVLGYRIDDRYKVDSTTRNIVLITILNNTDTI